MNSEARTFTLRYVKCNVAFKTSIVFLLLVVAILYVAAKCIEPSLVNALFSLAHGHSCYHSFICYLLIASVLLKCYWLYQLDECSIK